jgi:hypothetical protein
MEGPSETRRVLLKINTFVKLVHLVGPTIGTAIILQRTVMVNLIKPESRDMQRRRLFTYTALTDGFYN